MHSPICIHFLAVDIEKTVPLRDIWCAANSLLKYLQKILNGLIKKSIRTFENFFRKKWQENCPKFHCQE